MTTVGVLEHSTKDGKGQHGGQPTMVDLGMCLRVLVGLNHGNEHENGMEETIFSSLLESEHQRQKQKLAKA